MSVTASRILLSRAERPTSSTSAPAKSAVAGGLAHGPAAEPPLIGGELRRREGGYRRLGPKKLQRDRVPGLGGFGHGPAGGGPDRQLNRSPGGENGPASRPFQQLPERS